MMKKYPSIPANILDASMKSVIITIKLFEVTSVALFICLAFLYYIQYILQILPHMFPTLYLSSLISDSENRKTLCINCNFPILILPIMQYDFTFP